MSLIQFSSLLQGESVSHNGKRFSVKQAAKDKLNYLVGSRVKEFILFRYFISACYLKKYFLIPFSLLFLSSRISDGDKQS